MKKYKTLTSLLLALTLALTLALPALAAEDTDTGSITVKNPLAGTTYDAYQIFDVTYVPGGGTGAQAGSYKYSIEGDSPWFAVVTKTNDEGKTISAVAGLKIEEDGGKYNVTVDKNATIAFSAANFAAQLKEELAKNTAAYQDTHYEFKNNNGTLTATGLPLGYYLVTSGTGALCNLTTTTPTAEINEKNDVPFEKTADAVDVEVGQDVHFTLKGKVPATTGFKEYTYKMTDKMSDGLTFNQDVTVKIGGVDYTKDENVKIAYDNLSGDIAFRVTINVMALQEKVGEDIEVSYSAKVNEKAVTVISENTATLEYTNNPDGSTNKVTSEKQVYSYKIQILKHESGNENKVLEGAQFRLRNVDDNYYKEVKGTTGSGAITDIEWVENADQATTVKTDENGQAAFKGLKEGTYELVEVEAPDGYNKLSGPVTIEVKGGDEALALTDKDDITAALTVTAKVANNNGSVIPSTGGIGTTIFYVVGAVLVVGAGVLLVTKKRMEG
ncbi:MAG: SpaH/EbpB family LPXTG-anchored major pilin [Clostridiales bacterium]|nr:SpaH/EbpB family LPXTG-anchored major pilin [Clostridiales bacterium]MDY4171215.1 SpaH/EbpB family LPXTG-anchored major pilin [Evtepia sp.]